MKRSLRQAQLLTLSLTLMLGASIALPFSVYNMSYMGAWATDKNINEKAEIQTLPGDITDLKQPLLVRMLTPLDAKVDAVGTPFEAANDQVYTYHQTVLPAGTHFYGEIANMRQSKRLARPGYMTLAVSRVVLPDGQEYRFENQNASQDEVEANNKSDKSQRVYYEDADTRKRNKKKSRAVTGAGLGTSVALNVAGVSAFPFSMAVRAVVGTAMEFADKDSDKSTAKKIGSGLLGATPIPLIYKLSRKAPNPKFDVNDSVDLYLGEEKMQLLFEHLASLPARPSLQQPASPVPVVNIGTPLTQPVGIHEVPVSYQSGNPVDDPTRQPHPASTSWQSENYYQQFSAQPTSEPATEAVAH